MEEGEGVAEEGVSRSQYLRRAIDVLEIVSLFLVSFIRS